MTDETEANAVTDASQASATTGTQQSETQYSDKGRQAQQIAGNESDQDLGGDEAMAMAIAQAVVAYQSDQKRSTNRTETELANAIAGAQGHLARVQGIAEVNYSNLVLRANDQNASRQTYHDVSVDRLLNINEDSAAAVQLAAVIANVVKSTQE